MSKSETTMQTCAACVMPSACKAVRRCNAKAEPETTAEEPFDLLAELHAAGGGRMPDHLCQLAAAEIERLRSVLREVRRDIIESADDVVWMRGGIETVVDRINAAIGTEGDE